MKKKIAILDDHSIWADAIKQMICKDPVLKTRVAPPAVYCKPSKFFEEYPSNGYDALILDLDLGDGEENGIDVIDRMKATHPEVKILVLTVTEDKELCKRLFGAGCDGYICKSDSRASILRSVRDVVLNGTIGLADCFQPSKMTSIDVAGYDHLSDREREVFALVVRGCSSKQIADKLGLSAATVNTHRSRIIKKLGTKDWQAIAKSIGI